MGKKYLAIIASFSLMLFFQNCGQEYATSSLYGDNLNRVGNDDCISAVVDCGPRVEFLQVSIDTPNPLAIAAATTSYTIAGRCNVGNYPQHYIRYEVTNSTGVLRLAQNLNEVCLNGRYEFRLTLSALTVNEGHTLTISIVGIDDDGNSYSNMQTGGSATIDFYRM